MRDDLLGEINRIQAAGCDEPETSLSTLLETDMCKRLEMMERSTLWDSDDEVKP